jgi:putative methyltransferase (TIGR04325 family)
MGIRRWREEQIAAAAKLVRLMSHVPGGSSLLRGLQTSGVTRGMYRAAVGYRRPFATLGEAKAAIAGYEALGHEGNETVKHHLALSSAPRPSDYAAFFHLQPIAQGLHRVFDLGGNAGNLFYCYSGWLPWPAEMRWQVLDLPANMAAGAAIAAERGATQLSFTGDWSQASGADLLILSGSLHYMEHPLAEMLRQLSALPTNILINRTPLTDGEPAAAIQVGSGFRVACMIHNRTDLVRSLEELGYEAVDQWKAPELSLEIPGYPQNSIPAYSGIFLRHK